MAHRYAPPSQPPATSSRPRPLLASSSRHRLQPRPRQLPVPVPGNADVVRASPYRFLSRRHTVERAGKAQDGRVEFDGERTADVGVADVVGSKRRFVVRGPIVAEGGRRAGGDAGRDAGETQLCRRGIDGIQRSSPAEGLADIRSGEQEVTTDEQGSRHLDSTRDKGDAEEGSEADANSGSEGDILFLVEAKETKRRRKSTVSPPSSPSRLQAEHPPHKRSASFQQQHYRQEDASPSTPAHPPPSAARHRFKLPAAKPAPVTTLATSTSTAANHQSSSDIIDVATTSSRPHFLLPPTSPSPSKTATPAPDIFSPSRRTGRFVQGGLATAVQTWILEAAALREKALHSQSGRKGSRHGSGGVDEGSMRVKVSQLYGLDVIQGRYLLGSATTRIECEPQNHATSPRRGVEDKAKETHVHPGSVTLLRGTTNAGLYNVSRLGPPSPRKSSQTGAPTITAEAPSASVNVLLLGGGSLHSTSSSTVHSSHNSLAGNSRRFAHRKGCTIREGAVLGLGGLVWDVDLGSSDAATVAAGAGVAAALPESGEQDGARETAGAVIAGTWIVGVEWSLHS